MSTSSHSIRPIYLSISVSVIDSRFAPRKFPTGAIDAPICVRFPYKPRYIACRQCETGFRAQLSGVNSVLIPGLSHLLEAYVCFIRLTSFCLNVYMRLAFDNLVEIQARGQRVVYFIRSPSQKEEPDRSGRSRPAH